MEVGPRHTLGCNNDQYLTRWDPAEILSAHAIHHRHGDLFVWHEPTSGGLRRVSHSNGETAASSSSHPQLLAFPSAAASTSWWCATDGPGGHGGALLGVTAVCYKGGHGGVPEGVMAV